MARISNLRPVRSRIARNPAWEFGEAYLMVEAAKGFFIDGLTQKEVGERLKLSQASVSRLLTRARDERVIEFHLKPRPEHALANELTDKLRHTCVKRVVVVPGGSGKNEGNLAGPAASMILEDLEGISDQEIRITSSAGRTVHAVFESLILGLRSPIDDAAGGRTVEFYPAVLGNGYSVDLSYPATQATTLALSVNRAFGTDYHGDDSGEEGRVRIKACAPSLPPNFYSSALSADERAEYLERYGINEIMDLAKRAQLFVVGIGDARGARYLEILEKMNKALRVRVAKDAVAEVAWIPFSATGEVLAEVERDLVAVKPSELRACASGTTQEVIAVAGGAAKVAAIEAALIDPCFSTLVTDVINARRLIDSERVGG